MEYKVGDMVLCKRSVLNRSGNEIFIKGYHYKITEVNLPNNDIEIEFDILIEGHLEGKIDNFGFDINEYFNGEKFKLFDYHFYTKEEERKLKIEKINGI